MSDTPNILQITPCAGIWAELSGPFMETIPVVGFGKMPKGADEQGHPWVPLVYDDEPGALTTLEAYAKRRDDEAHEGLGAAHRTPVKVRLVTKD